MYTIEYARYPNNPHQSVPVLVIDGHIIHFALKMFLKFKENGTQHKIRYMCNYVVELLTAIISENSTGHRK